MGESKKIPLSGLLFVLLLHILLLSGLLFVLLLLILLLSRGLFVLPGESV